MIQSLHVRLILFASLFQASRSSSFLVYSSYDNGCGTALFSGLKPSTKASTPPPPSVELQEKIKSVAKSLWGGDLNNVPTCQDNVRSEGKFLPSEGEAIFRRNHGQDFSKRKAHFYNEAMKGCPKSQHSYGLLLWSGFDTNINDGNSNTQQNAQESAKFHAAAAYQNHLDSIAILGGCLRKGSGVKKKDIEVGIQLIEYSAQAGNPSGINKKAALLQELESDESAAFNLYEKSYKNDRINALLLFNLGWYYMKGLGMDVKDEGRGLELWTKAADMAPDEGSEESSWFLYDYYKHDEPKLAEKWLRLAANLGYPEAVDEYDQLKSMFGEY